MNIVEKNIVVYNNCTGIVERMEPLFIGEGMKLHRAESLWQLYEILLQGNVHLMILDIELDGEDWQKGIQTLQDIRSRCRIPMIVVSQQSDETAKIMALEAGADDYVLASCNPLELLARVKSQLRRYMQLINLKTNIDRIYRVDGLEINDIQRTVRVDGRTVRLTPIEYKILRLLVQERGRVFSISQIYESIWHMQAIGADNTIAVHIRHIREKIESNPKDPQYLKVVWGTGYKVG